MLVPALHSSLQCPQGFFFFGLSPILGVGWLAFLVVSLAYFRRRRFTGFVSLASFPRHHVHVSSFSTSFYFSLALPQNVCSLFIVFFNVSLEALSSSAAGSSDSPLAGLARGGVGVVSPLSRSPEIVERFFSARPNRPDALGCPDALDRNAKEYLTT